jgi:hypothetical protein
MAAAAGITPGLRMRMRHAKRMIEPGEGLRRAEVMLPERIDSCVLVLIRVAPPYHTAAARPAFPDSEGAVTDKRKRIVCEFTSALPLLDAATHYHRSQKDGQGPVRDC